LTRQVSVGCIGSKAGTANSGGRMSAWGHRTWTTRRQ